MGADKGKRLGLATWNEIKAKYLAGEKVSDLAAEYNVTSETISRRATKYNWRRPEELKTLALKEVEQEIKDDYKALARQANHEQLQVCRAARKVGIDMLKKLNLGELPGQACYQYRIVLEGLKIAHDGIRQALRIDDINAPFDGVEQDDENDVKLLLKILSPKEAGEIPQNGASDDDLEDDQKESFTIN